METDDTALESPSLDLDTYPEDLLDIEQWLAWKETPDGRKIPRAPYVHTEWPDRFVDAQDPTVWTDFETVREWVEKLSGYDLAFTIRDREQHPDEDVVLIDYDKVRDPDTGQLHPTVTDHLAKAASYADVSISRTGVHILCQGALPEGVKTIADTLPAHDNFPDAEIEVYDSARFVAMTGAHVKGTPRETTEVQAFLDELVDDYATVVESTPDALLDEPTKSKTELAAIDATDDIQDVFDAVQQTVPGDITLRSPVTEERSDGSKSRDPYWTSSESGTRLAEVGSGWIYREGMVGMDALQVVALEEGIITDERSYPSGEQFWQAVDALRDRGAHIPAYDSDVGTDTPAVADAIDAETAVDTPDVDPALEYEAELLRETVKEQRARIDELERTLEDRDTTIDEQRERLARLEAELKRLREQLNVNGDDQPETASAEDASTWEHMKDRLLDRDS